MDAGMRRTLASLICLGLVAGPAASASAQQCDLTYALGIVNTSTVSEGLFGGLFGGNACEIDVQVQNQTRLAGNGIHAELNVSGNRILTIDETLAAGQRKPFKVTANVKCDQVALNTQLVWQHVEPPPPCVTMVQHPARVLDIEMTQSR
jgi:hypothetical protein